MAALVGLAALTIAAPHALADPLPLRDGTTLDVDQVLAADDDLLHLQTATGQQRVPFAEVAPDALCALLRGRLDRPLAAQRISVARTCARHGAFAPARAELQLARAQSHSAADQARRVLAEVDRLEAAALLAQARASHAAGRSDPARAQLAHLIERFPDTPAADEARADLDAQGFGPDGVTQGRFVTLPGAWYGWETLIVDGASILTAPLIVGAGGYVFGAPIVHITHGNPGHAAASLGLRLVLPLGGGALAYTTTRSGYSTLTAFALGALTAMTLDSLLLAHDDDQRVFTDDPDSLLSRAPASPSGYLGRPVHVDLFARAGTRNHLAGLQFGYAVTPEVAIVPSLAAATGSRRRDYGPVAAGLGLQLRPAARVSSFTPTLGGTLEYEFAGRTDLNGSLGFEWQGRSRFRVGGAVAFGTSGATLALHLGHAY